MDTFLSADQTRELADWIAASGKKLTTVYVTHSSAASCRASKAVATVGVVEAHAETGFAEGSRPVESAQQSATPASHGGERITPRLVWKRTQPLR